MIDKCAYNFSFQPTPSFEQYQKYEYVKKAKKCQKYVHKWFPLDPKQNMRVLKTLSFKITLSQLCYEVVMKCKSQTVQFMRNKIPSLKLYVNYIYYNLQQNPKNSNPRKNILSSYNVQRKPCIKLNFFLGYIFYLEQITREHFKQHIFNANGTQHKCKEQCELYSKEYITIKSMSYKLNSSWNNMQKLTNTKQNIPGSYLPYPHNKNTSNRKIGLKKF
eukprot:TRINITY_DN2496_c0_g1_i11.p6 TRINITY_DN2496_c0_g1~~TRINITY_DN2496_c0_g1_i11.p6  ORF type:complete len:218 (-),score=-11.72 TRINITY_DN2496_c0_g1_i11:1535-2188(-)